MKDLSFCRSAFPSLYRTSAQGKPLIYLDGPGGSQVPASVVTAIADYYLHRNSNTHGQFVTSEESDAVIAEARHHMALMLGASSPESISFGQNMTTLNFLLSQAIAEMLNPGDEIVVTQLDHDSNVAPWVRLVGRGVVVRTVPLRSDGQLDLEIFHSLIGPKTRLVAMGWASNALGTVNPVNQVRRWTREVGAWLLIDAVHWAPHGPIDTKELQPDFLLCSAYKFFGPHVGILYSQPGLLDQIPTLKVRPQNDTGPERIETGTLNHAALAGVTAAVQFIASLADSPAQDPTERIHQAMTNVYTYEHELAGRLYNGLSSMNGITVYGPPVGAADRAPTVSFTSDTHGSLALARSLGQEGIQVWDGDFYAIGVVEALGLAAQGGLVRLGLAPYNTRAEVDDTLSAIERLTASPA